MVSIGGFRGGCMGCDSPIRRKIYPPPPKKKVILWLHPLPFRAKSVVKIIQQGPPPFQHFLHPSMIFDSVGHQESTSV